MNYLRKAGIGLALTGLGGALAVVPAHATDTTIGLYDTGVDSSGNVTAANLSPDAHYVLTSVPVGSSSTTAVLTSGYPLSPDGPYIPNTSTSAWIGPYNPPATDLNGPGGTYDFQTTFDLTGYTQTELDGLALTGEWATDNTGADIILNSDDTGDMIPNDLSFEGPLTSFSIAGSNLTAGVNTLTFVVDNTPISNPDNPTAVRVENLDLSPAPEPAQIVPFAFIGLGLGGLILRARKRRSLA